MNTATLDLIYRSFASYISSPNFWLHVAISFSRVISGVTLGIAYAVVLIAIGQTSKSVSSAVSAFNSAIRYAPPTAFIGLIIFLFGLGGEAAIALICLGTAPYILLMFMDTLGQRPTAYDDFVRLYRIPPIRALFVIYIPYAMPGWLRAIRVNIGAAWTFLIVAEMIGAQSGVGYLMSVSQRFLKVADMIALILVVGLLGLLTDVLLARLQSWLSPWQGRHYG